MLLESIQEIKEWAIDNHTYPELIKWIPKYLLHQGLSNFVDLGDMSQTMRRIGLAQDRIGWRYFMEGKIAHPL